MKWFLVDAIQRKYEMVRRNWALEQKENSTQLIEAKAKASKYRARRIRVSATPFHVASSSTRYCYLCRNFKIVPWL